MSTLPEEKSKDVLGFRPSSNQPSPSIVAEAKAELLKEHNEKCKGKVKELLKQAYDMEIKITTLARDTENQLGGLRKQLGKLHNRIEAMERGQEPPKEEGEPQTT